jgi:hypothetical protein
VADDGNVVAGGTAERTTVTGLVLDVGENGTLGHGVEGQDVADGERGVLSGVDELCAVSPCFSCFAVSKLTWPVYMPSLAMKVSVLCLNRYGYNLVSYADAGRLAGFVRCGK